MYKKSINVFYFLYFIFIELSVTAMVSYRHNFINRFIPRHGWFFKNCFVKYNALLKCGVYTFSISMFLICADLLPKNPDNYFKFFDIEHAHYGTRFVRLFIFL